MADSPEFQHEEQTFADGNPALERRQRVVVVIALFDAEFIRILK